MPLTIAICAAAAAVGRRWRYAEAVVAAVLVPLTLTAAQAHRAYWHQRSDEQRQMLGAIAVAVSEAPRSDHLLVIDTANLLGRDVYALQGQILVTALLYVRHAPDDVIVHCGPLGAPPVAGVSSGCQRTPAGFAVDGAPPVRFPVVVTLKAAGGASPPANLANITPRERDLLPCVRRRSCGRIATLTPG